MADGIVIEINLDGAKFKKQQKDFKDEAVKTSEEIGKALDDNISKTINNSVTVSIKNMGQTMTKTTETMSDSVGKMSFNINQTTKAVSGLAATGALLVPVAKNFKSITELTTKLSTILFRGGGLFGFISALGATSVALLGVSKALESTNNSFLKSVGFVAKLTSILVGGLGVALTLVTLKIAELVQVAGTRLVEFFDQAAVLFNNTEQSLDVFRATVDAAKRSVQGSIAPFEVWEAVVGRVARTFNFTRDAIRKSAQEILLVGPKLGLVESQMKKLIRVSAEYAKINKKDVFQTTVNFVNALNGNAQAVAALGVKLTAASLQQFAYTKGITKSIQKLSEGEKVQLRFNKVMKQYSEVSGIGIIAANSLAEASKRVEIQQKRLQAALGEGSRIIERNNILAFIYDKFLNNISGTVAKLGGFIGALGSRLLQFAGIFLQVSLTTFAVIKGFKILKALLESDLGIRAFASNIPILNKSMNTLLSSLTGTQVEIKSLGSLMKALSTTSSKAFNSFSQVIFGRGTKNLTILNAMTGAVGQLRLAFARLIPIMLPILIPLAKIALIGGLVVGAFLAVKKAFQEIEKRTGALSSLWQIMLDVFAETSSIFQPIIKFFGDITESIKTLVFKGFGLLVSGLTGVISIITSLAKRNPFGVFSKDTIVKLTGLDNKLKDFRQQIAGVGFDMRKMGDASGRALASVGNAAKVNLEEIARTLNELREKYATFGMSQVAILRQQQTQQLEALRIGLENNLILKEEFLVLEEQLNRDFANRIALAQEESDLRRVASFENVTAAFKIHAKNMKTTSGELAKTLLDLSVRGFGNAFRSMGAAIAQGGNAMQAFADSIKAVFGDLAGAIGDYYIKRGVAGVAANEPGAGAMIAAGAALKVLSGVLGAGATAGGTAGAGGGVAGGAGGVQDTTTGQITEARADRPEADTNVIVNIQGDILDGQETGKRLVDVLGDSFSKEGLILRDVRTA